MRGIMVSAVCMALGGTGVARAALLYSTGTVGADLTFAPLTVSGPLNLYEDNVLSPLPGGGGQGKGWGSMGFVITPAAGDLREVSAAFQAGFPDGLRMEVYKVTSPVTTDANGVVTSGLDFVDSAVVADIVNGKQWLTWNFTADGTTGSFDGTSSYLFMPSLLRTHGEMGVQQYYWLGRSGTGTHMAETNVTAMNTDLPAGVVSVVKNPLTGNLPWLYVSDTVSVPEPGTMGMLGLAAVGVLARRGRRREAGLTRGGGICTGEGSYGSFCRWRKRRFCVRGAGRRSS